MKHCSLAQSAWLAWLLNTAAPAVAQPVLNPGKRV